ncbi:MAG: dienelactone hydrolase family protein [Deltaproteobacteria bacterium]|nr:dienelactone hydrolase family protein [Deltaproteobacteria bacterium]
MADTIERIEGTENEYISRREFIQKSAVITGGLAATALADSANPSRSYSAQVDPNDPGLSSTEIKFPSTDGTPIGGYLTRPKKDGSLPAVVVIHENRGLNDHIRDVARRLAKAGYVALAPDLLTRQGGTASFATPDDAIAAIRKVDEDTITKDLTGAINYLKGQNFVRSNKIGVVGFCWGGGNSLLIATRNRDLAAAVVYYGRSPKNLDDVQNISGAVLGHYGEKDQPITSAVPKLEAAMKKHGKSFEYKVYPGAPHAFNNDTNPQRYNASAAKEAWDRTLEFFKKHLQS